MTSDERAELMRRSISKPCRFSNRDWPSQRVCARAHGVSEHVMGRWIKAGLTEPPDPTPRRFEGHSAESWAALGRKLGVDPSTAKRWVERGYRPDAGEGNRKRCRIHGVVYASEVHAACARGVSRQAISSALRKGRPWAQFV